MQNKFERISCVLGVFFKIDFVSFYTLEKFTPLFDSTYLQNLPTV